LIGFSGDVLKYEKDWKFLFEITGMAIYGNLLGNKLQNKISSARLRRIFGWFILGMGFFILIREFMVSNPLN
jgi:uncharacterized membrane protein YfcA